MYCRLCGVYDMVRYVLRILRHSLGISIIFASCVYGFSERYTLIEQNVEDYEVLLRYDAWTKTLCTLNKTKLTESLLEYKLISSFCTDGG